MSPSVLLVDDDELVLKAYRRFLQPPDPSARPTGWRLFEVETSSSAAAALKLVATRRPYAVVVSDYKMPGLNGVKFLEEVKALQPTTVRMMLTGAADIDAAIDSVNRGSVFRFLTKPCLPTTLGSAVAAALRQYELVRAERDLLEQTVGGVVRVLMDTLTLINPPLSRRAHRARRCVRHMVRKLNLGNAWQLEVAAMLSQFGHVVLGADPTSATDEPDHAALAQQLLGHIPRFEDVAAIIARQASPNRDDADVPFADRDRIAFGGQVLRLALEFEAATSAGQTPAEAVEALSRRRSGLDRTLVRSLVDVDADLCALTPRTVALSVLRAGMVLDEDLVGPSGVLIMAHGQEVTETMLARMLRMSSSAWLRTTVRVLVSQAAQFDPLPRTEASAGESPAAGGS